MSLFTDFLQKVFFKNKFRVELTFILKKGIKIFIVLELYYFYFFKMHHILNY